MIYMFPHYARSNAPPNSGFVSASLSGLKMGGKAITNCKHALLSCLNSISNTFEHLKKPFYTKYTFSSNTREFVSKQTLEPIAEWSIKKISLEQITQICQAVISQMRNNPDNLNGMFRSCPARGAIERLCADLEAGQDLIPRINSGVLKLHDVSTMVKLWCEQIMDQRKFTRAEAQLLLTNKTGSDFGKDILAKKLASNSSSAGEDWHKLMVIFSLLNAYREVCSSVGANEQGSQRKYNEETLLTCVFPRFFEISDGGNGTLGWSINNVTDGKVAFLALLTAHN